MKDVGLGEKKYSPDLQTYSFDGASGVFGTIASIIVGPFRLVLRVFHNIVILPANLLSSYSDGLFIVGILLGMVGAFDFFLNSKWPLLVSQIPVIALAVILKRKAKKAVKAADFKPNLDIDTESIEKMCDDVYNELDNLVNGENKSE